MHRKLPLRQAFPKFLALRTTLFSKQITYVQEKVAIASSFYKPPSAGSDLKLQN
jgi:hypothetical protein